MSSGKVRPKSSKRVAATKSVVKSGRPEAADDPVAASLRRQFMLTQAQFAPVLSVSIRSLATLEAGSSPTPAVARRLSELARLLQALAEVVEPKAIGAWMLRPNAAFDGFKPLEIIERGEVDRIWAMVYALRSGVAS